MPNITQVDQQRFQQLLANDPDVQAIIQKVWGNTPINQRPGDTPKNLEKANHDASVQIGQILKQKGVQLPPHTFINPRSGSLEGERGWAGLPTGVKIAIIGGAALATGGALGAFGGAAAGGAAGSAAVPSLGVTSGLAGTGLTGAGIAGTSGAAIGAGGAGMAGIGAAAKGAGMASKIFGSGSVLSKISNVSKLLGPLTSGLASGAQKGREAQNSAASDTATFNLNERNSNERNQVGRADLDLRRRDDARTGQSDAYKKALQSALGMNLKDFEIDPASLPRGVSLIKSTGGMRPSAIGPEGRAAHAAMNKQAMAKLLAGEQYDDLPALERTAAPTYKGPGAFENIVGGIGMGANAYNSYKAGNEQQSMQDRLMNAIEATKAQGGAPPPNVSVSTRKLPPPPMDDPYADWSNR